MQAATADVDQLTRRRIASAVRPLDSKDLRASPPCCQVVSRVFRSLVNCCSGVGVSPQPQMARAIKQSSAFFVIQERVDDRAIQSSSANRMNHILRRGGRTATLSSAVTSKTRDATGFKDGAQDAECLDHLDPHGHLRALGGAVAAANLSARHSPWDLTLS